MSGLTLESFKEVSPGDVRRCELQPRRLFDQDKICELADSIRDLGLQQPVTVRHKDGALELIFGERRWRACSLIRSGYLSPAAEGFVDGDPDFRMPAIVREMSDHDVLKSQLIENLQREDMTPIEEARGYERMVRDFGESIRSTAQILGLPYNRVYRRLQLMRLPQVWQDRLEAGLIPIYVADLALSVPEDAPSAVEGKTVLEDALETAHQARSQEEARYSLDKRYKRPFREKELWNREEMDAERQRVFQEWCEEHLTCDAVEDPEVLSHARSRDIFPDDVTELLPMNAGDFVHAEDWPDPALDNLAPGKEPTGCWGDLAVKYDAPLFLACDGKMVIRVVVRKDLVREGAILAAESPEQCLFLVGDAAGQRLQQQAAKKANEEFDRALEERGDRADEMLRALDAAIRERVAAGMAPPPLFYEAAFFGLQVGALGFERTDHPTVQLLDRMGIDLEADGVLFAHWPGLFVDGQLEADLRAGLESLAVCSLVFYHLDLHQGDLAECPEWREAADVYEVEWE